MKKKVLLTIAAVAAVALGVAGMSAFEAHVINVTAQIENALSVTPEELVFGTVFPQEMLEQNLYIGLSGSFMEEPRVDDVNYVIKQKPKVRVINELTGKHDPYAIINPSTYPDGITAHEYCLNEAPLDPGDIEDEYYLYCFPNLCGQISKLPDMAPENDGAQPSPHEWSPDDPGVMGRLAKSEADLEDNWTIDLKVPCFEGYCDQAYDPAVYGEPLDPRLEHEMFGCDLWVEVTGISLTGDPYCGDGIINQPSEECDDGNNLDGDGCDSECQVEEPVCGNGIVEGDEECDDGNNLDGDGCDSECQVEEPVCGNGIVEGDEECDDGNTEDGDGCSANCTLPENCNDVCLALLGCDGGYECFDGFCRDSDCPDEEDCICAVPECGDGFVDEGEECDDGNTEDNDGCSSTCQNEYCGDGIVQTGEGCDEGSKCEDGTDCTGNPDICIGIGDGSCAPRDSETCYSDCTAPLGCLDKADVMMVLDRSGSIGSDIEILKIAAIDFVNALGPEADGVHMGQVSFAQNATLDVHLTDDTTVLEAAINALISFGRTNLVEALSFASGELANPGDGHDRIDTESPDYMIVITDGQPNEPYGTPEADAAAAAAAAQAEGTIIYVVGVGQDVDPTYLSTQIASDPSLYFPASNYAALEAILQGIAECNGS